MSTKPDLKLMQGAELEFASALEGVVTKTGSRIDPIRQAEIASAVFERVLSRATKEHRVAQACARGIGARAKLAADEGGCVSVEEAARLIGTSKESILRRYRAGKLLGWKAGAEGSLLLPVWQFQLKGLTEVLDKLNAPGILDDWGRILFFLATHGALGNRRPLDLLRENRLDLVLPAAVAYVE